MAQAGDLLRGIAAVLWVVLALAVVYILRGGIVQRLLFVTKLGFGATGFSMEFAEQKLDQAMATVADPSSVRSFGQAARRGVLVRLERNADLVSRARLVWVDDHPENNLSIIQLLTGLGARVDTPRTNDEAFRLLRGSRYDVVISDVARDREGPESALKGVRLAQTVFEQFGQQTLLFTERYNPATLPGLNEAQRLELVKVTREVVFGTTNRYDEALHLILDMLERGL